MMGDFMLNNMEKIKIKKAAIISFIIGVVVVVVFPFVDDMNWSYWVIPGSFLMGFTPVFIIMLFDALVSSRYFARMHGVIQVLLNTVVYLLIIVVSLVVVVIYMGLSPDYDSGKVGILGIISHPDTQLSIILTGVIILLIQIYFLLTSFLGKGVLLKLFLGIYHSPKVINKTFMFLDVKSSTSIAEKIGHLRFLSLLQEFFFDLSEAVAVSGGEIYKYVGDEAIIVWDMEKSFKNNNTLKCFFELKSIIKKKRETYKKKYGVVPDFKAGVHCGQVVIGEIGIEKKEISYLGDVINATARIEGICSEFDQDLVASGDYISNIVDKSNLILQDYGETVLRGKDKPLHLWGIGIGEN